MCVSISIAYRVSQFCVVEFAAVVVVDGVVYVAPLPVAVANLCCN